MSNRESAHKNVLVTPVPWLQPGWMLAVSNGRLEATRVEVPRGDIENFAGAILNRLEELKTGTTTGGIFMAEGDCSLITEHFPDAFYKTNTESK